MVIRGVMVTIFNNTDFTLSRAFGLNPERVKTLPKLDYLKKKMLLPFF